MTHTYKTSLVFEVMPGEDVEAAAKEISAFSDGGCTFEVQQNAISNGVIPVKVVAANGQDYFMGRYRLIKEKRGKDSNTRLFSHVRKSTIRT